MKWFKVWTKILTAPDFRDLSPEIIGHWTLIGAYAQAHGESGRFTINERDFLYLFKVEKTALENVKNELKKVNVLIVYEEGNSDNRRITVIMSNWFKYQVDSTGYERLKKHRKAKNDNGTREEKKREDKRRKDKRRKDKDLKEESAIANAMPSSTPKKKSPAIPDDEWIENLKANPVWAGIKIDMEKEAWLTWCAQRGITPTRLRFLNWLKKAEKPMDLGGINGRSDRGNGRKLPDYTEDRAAAALLPDL